MTKTIYLHTKTQIIPLTIPGSKIIFLDKTTPLFEGDTIFNPRIVINDCYIVFEHPEKERVLKVFEQFHSIINESNEESNYYLHNNGIINMDYTDDLYYKHEGVYQ